MNYGLIDSFMQAKGMRKEKFYDTITMSKSGYITAIERNTLKVRDLENIADVLEVDPCVFLKEDFPTEKIHLYINAGKSSQTSEYKSLYMTEDNYEHVIERQKEELKALKKEIKLKDEMIRDKERMIQILMEK